MARVSEAAKARFREYSRQRNRSEAGRASRQRYAAAHPERILATARKSHYKTKYGLSFEEWGILFALQGGCCAACESLDPGGKKGWHVDHDHNRTDPHARAILCNPCNVALGHAKDSVHRLRALTAYMTSLTGS